MKVKFSNIQLFFFGILLGSALPAFAQDGAPTPTPVDPKEINVNPELNANEDKTFVVESSESLKPSGATTTTVKETASVKSATTKPKAETKAGEKEETDPMSFNFLYILIQKFKFSDMVD